jgi:5-methylcytosine-specific restriction endonuclease McrA
VKLQQLQTQLRPAECKVNMLPTQRSETVECKRGLAGVRDRNRIQARDCGLCQECKRNGRTTLGSQVDQVFPLWKKGSNDDSNKEVLCVPCHDAKPAREAAERARGG